VPRAIRSVLRPARTVLRRHLPLRAVAYEGSHGTAWLAGVHSHAPSIAAFFSGDDVRPGPRGRVWRQRIPRRIADVAGAGGLPILELPEPDPWFGDLLQCAIAAPVLVDIHRDLPADLDVLRRQLLTSTTREDFRRIRRANFSYRVTSDPDAIREFHARYYTPLVTHQYPEDGIVGLLKDMLSQGGELVCADIDGEWVAGVFNIPQEASYRLGALGIRDADDAVRQKRVVAALIVRSLERAVELGRDRATLGRSLPFLGKGPVWFKAKWGGILTREPGSREMYMFMDLRQAAVRRMLSAGPVIHAEGNALVVSTWLEPGDEPVQTTIRDADRFPGISRWYVLALPETLAAGAAQLSASEPIVPVPVTPDGHQPLWLGEVLAETALGNSR
jgi:Acetyltransferase (GNAT) domain